MPTRAYLFVSSILLCVVCAVSVAVFFPRTQNIAIPVPPPSPQVLTPPSPAILTTRIVVASPISDSEVSSPLLVTGEAPGTWFFEGSFPVELRDASYSLIASGIATSSEDWMTTSPIPFEATLTWASTTATSGTVILIKDNPSGLPEHDDRELIDVRISP